MDRMLAYIGLLISLHVLRSLVDHWKPRSEPGLGFVSSVVNLATLITAVGGITFFFWQYATRS